MLDTRLGQEILREGVQKGIKKGIPQGAQHILLRMIATRFGKAPADVRRKIMVIKDTEKLDRIAVKLLTARSLAEFKKAL